MSNQFFEKPILIMFGFRDRVEIEFNKIVDALGEKVL